MMSKVDKLTEMLEYYNRKTDKLIKCTIQQGGASSQDTSSVSESDLSSTDDISISDNSKIKNKIFKISTSSTKSSSSNNTTSNQPKNFEDYFKDNENNTYIEELNDDEVFISPLSENEESAIYKM
jgi:hypothetical protein